VTKRVFYVFYLKYIESLSDYCGCGNERKPCNGLKQRSESDIVQFLFGEITVPPVRD